MQLINMDVQGVLQRLANRIAIQEAMFLEIEIAVLLQEQQRTNQLLERLVALQELQVQRSVDDGK